MGFIIVIWTNQLLCGDVNRPFSASGALALLAHHSLKNVDEKGRLLVTSLLAVGEPLASLADAGGAVSVACMFHRHSDRLQRGPHRLRYVSTYTDRSSGLSGRRCLNPLPQTNRHTLIDTHRLIRSEGLPAVKTGLTGPLRSRVNAVGHTPLSICFVFFEPLRLQLGTERLVKQKS